MDRQLRRAEPLVQGLSLYTKEFGDLRPLLAWLGPALLLAGILFGGAAALLAIGSPG